MNKSLWQYYVMQTCRHVYNEFCCMYSYIYMYLCPCVCVLYRMSLHSARINAFVENYISNEKEVQIFVRCLREVTVHEIDSKINLHYIDFTRFHFACVFHKCIFFRQESRAWWHPQGQPPFLLIPEMYSENKNLLKIGDIFF